jgi:hypothetical protein
MCLSDCPVKKSSNVLAPQRRYFEGALQRARNKVGAEASFPNHQDYLTNVEMSWCSDAETTLCTATDAQGARLANSVEELAERCVKAEAGSDKQSKLIEDLQNQVDDLERFIRDGGPRRGNKS